MNKFSIDATARIPFFARAAHLPTIAISSVKWFWHMGMMRGILNKKLAEGLRFTKENRWLTDHYNNYPESPDGFEAWSTKLRTRIADANTKLERFQN